MTPDSISYSSVDTSSCPLEQNETANTPSSPTSYKHFDSDNVTPRHDVARSATFVSSVSSSFSKDKVVTIIGEEDAEVLEVTHQPFNDYDRQRILSPKAKVSVNVRNAAGQSPLSVSSSKCFLEGMKLLIDKGADINHLACEKT